MPCKDAGPQKKQGRLTSQQAAPHGIYTPLFDGGKPGQDTACRLPDPLLILEYTEKKELPIYHVKRHKALAVRITELTEELEELRSEKALLLQKFEYAEDAGAEAFHKDIAAMEAGLKKLETQEQKYSAELDKALDEYAELKAQAADFDPVELYEARQAIRPAQEKAAEQQLEDALQKKPSFSLLLNAKQETSRLLKEDTEERQVRQMLIRRQRSDPQKPKHFQR